MDIYHFHQEPAVVLPVALRALLSRNFGLFVRQGKESGRGVRGFVGVRVRDFVKDKAVPRPQVKSQQGAKRSQVVILLKSTRSLFTMTLLLILLSASP